MHAHQHLIDLWLWAGDLLQFELFWPSILVNADSLNASSDHKYKPLFCLKYKSLSCLDKHVSVSSFLPGRTHSVSSSSVQRHSLRVWDMKRVYPFVSRNRHPQLGSHCN